MPDPIIKIDHVVKSYGKKEVLSGLSLDIPKGSVFGLLGKNGAGKTTLIKCILGLLQISSGKILTINDDPWNFSDITKASLGYVPQTDRLYPWLTPRQLVDYTASFYSRWNDKLVEGLIRDWEINPDEKIGLLSEGQAQKVSIIMALGHEPELLVFDEPVASLDPLARRQFLKTILEILSDRQCTILFSSHITGDLERVADHVAVIDDGETCFSGALDDLKDEVKIFKISSTSDLPQQYQYNGLIRWDVTGSTAIATVRGNSCEIKKVFEEQWNAQVKVEDLNLEDIFLELTR